MTTTTKLNRMNDLELDNVVGGNRDELALDTQLFAAMNRFKPYVLDDITDSNVNIISSKINVLYSKLGITVKYNDFGASSYSYNGRGVSRNEAVKIALNNAGYHDLDPAPFQIP